MLRIGQVQNYEISCVLFGTVLIMAIQMVTGPMFTWALWLYSIAAVSIGFVDHCCTGWKFTLEIQLRRMLYNFLNGLIAGTLLFGSVYILMPKDIQKIDSIPKLLVVMQRLIRMHYYFGPFLYTYLYFVLHETMLSFMRIWMNLGYIIFLAIDSVYPIAPIEST